MATISRVAELAGVSKATVSRVIRGKTRVPETMATRVRKELDFQPNALARALATSRSGGIGMVINDRNDQMALGVCNACNELGPDVPDDIPVVGFDDMDWARYLHPRLSTVRQHVEEMDFAAGSLLMGMLLQDDPDRPISMAGHRLQPGLVVRDPVRRLT